MENKVIDLNGFKDEVVVIKIGGEEYRVPVDMPPAPYFKFMDLLDEALKIVAKGGTITPEEDYKKTKDFLIDLIANTNKHAERKKLNADLHPTSVFNIFQQYSDIQEDRGVLKNLKSRANAKAKNSARKKAKKKRK